MSKYWQDRFKQLEKAMNAYGENTYAGVDEAFHKAQAEMQKEIDVWYARLARNNEISISEAKKLLSKKELAEFHWSVEEYIKHGEENGLNGQWMKQLENASAKYHISRLEALKIHTQQIAEKAFGNELDAVDRMARKVYTEDYYRAAFEIQKGFGVGFNIGQIDENRLSKIIAKPWAADGKNFSSRIWQSKTAMVNELHQQLTKTCVLGKSSGEAIAELSKYVDRRFRNARAQAGRLIMTEQAFFASAGQRDCYKDLGVEEFEIVATIDERTSDICQDMDGKHFPMSQYEEGVTAPPFHVWCRSTTCPYFNDEFTAGDTRAARDADGKTEYIPADMKYGEWKEKFVLKKQEDGGMIKIQIKGVEATKPEKVFKELTEEEFKAIKQPITKAERGIIYGRSHFSGYINSSNAKKINALMREGKELPQDYKDIVATLKAVIGRNKLPDSIITTRYVKDDALLKMFGVEVPQYKWGQDLDEFWQSIDAIPNLLKGDRVYTEKGFLSTSGIAQKNVMTKRGIKMIIKAPEGTPSYVSTNYKESEIIFGPDTTLHLVNSYIENPRTANRKIVLECEIR